jgi:uncharacterized protein YbjT (DUF2867 family)
MTAPILVTGGTGTLGRIVTPLLQCAGRTVRVLSRRPHESGDSLGFVAGDLTTGEGIKAAVDGVGTIVHCAGSAKGDEAMTGNLIDAASAAGATHLVFISVVGADRVPVISRLDRAMFGYFAAKRAAELVVEDSGLPWSTLRATQFYDLILTTVRAMAKMPVVPSPSGVRFQPIDTHEVATRLVEIALGGPSGLVPDIAGPRAYELKDLLRSYLYATHRHRLVVPVKIPGTSARAIRAGANIAPQHAVGRRTWEEFLTDRTSEHIGSP